LRIGIIASGPSANVQDAQKLRDCCDLIIAVNDSWRLCRGADGEYFNDYIYGTDMKWWKYAIGDIMRDFDGELWTQRVQWTEEPEALGIKCMESECKPDLCTEPGKIHTGSNSGFAAINLAYHLSGKTIVLLGYDLRTDGNKRHWFNNRPEVLNVTSNYNDFIKHFNSIDTAKHGIEILNASRRTSLNCFPLVDLDDMPSRALPDRTTPARRTTWEHRQHWRRWC
jgi:hypothetical protein